MNTKNNREDENILDKYENIFSKNTKRWKLTYRISLILSAFLSTSAVVILKLNWIGNDKSASDLSAILAGLSTIATVIAGSLNFENYWRSNQKAREQIRILRLTTELEKNKQLSEEQIKEFVGILKGRTDSLLKDD